MNDGCQTFERSHSYESERTLAPESAKSVRSFDAVQESRVGSRAGQRTQETHPPMAYLIERKSQTIFVTGTSIIAKGKPREMTVESRPEYAVVQLSGLREALPVPWEEVYQAAIRRHKANLRLEQEARRRADRSKHSGRKAI